MVLNGSHTKQEKMIKMNGVLV